MSRDRGPSFASSGRLALVVDTDTASDDAVALMIAALCGRADIKAVTTVAGNVDVDQATRNALYTLELCRADVPVYVGCNRPLLRARRDATAVHGADGMSDTNLPEPKSTARPEHAVDALRRVVAEHPHQSLTLVTLGPLTTVAAVLMLDEAFLSRFKHVYFMLGSSDMVGNIAPTAEYNAWADPEAAAIVMAHASAQNCTLIGCDVSVRDALIDDSTQQNLRALGTDAALFADDINRSTAIWMKNELGATGYDLPDPIAMAIALDPTLITDSEYAHVGVSVAEETAGQLIIDRRAAALAPNARVVRRADHRRFVDVLFETCRVDTSRQP